MKQPQTPDIPGSRSTHKDCEELVQLPWDSIHIGGSQEMHRHSIVPAAKSDDCATSGYKPPEMNGSKSSCMHNRFLRNFFYRD